MKRKAVVAMSGGVDSSVAAALMKEEGYDVTGIMLKLWQGAGANNESGCCSVDAAEDARRVAQVLDIPFYVLNFADRFDSTVVAHFKAGYAGGRTPNPCIECNRSVKFAALAERAKAYAATVLATGHYARVGRLEGDLRLMRGRDRSKDQSYVLYMMGIEDLAFAHFPVGDYSKTQIRDIAVSLGLRTAAKPDSQEICFVPNGDSHSFIREHVALGSRPGPITASSGERLGTHAGYAHYTIGQRRGLGVSAGTPLFVKEIRPRSNTVVVGRREELMVSSLRLADVSLNATSARSFHCSVMTRYRGPEAAALVTATGTEATIEFDEPQVAPAPGQAAVFYDGDVVLGGGTIEGSV